MENEERLKRIESMVEQLLTRQSTREWYTTEQFAELVGKSDYTCREYCRLGRIAAKKLNSGRGAYAGWTISHDELMRYQREGLRPRASRS